MPGRQVRGAVAMEEAMAEARAVVGHVLHQAVVAQVVAPLAVEEVPAAAPGIDPVPVEAMEVAQVVGLLQDRAVVI